MYTTPMDQIANSSYPSPRYGYSTPSVLFTVATLLFVCAPLNYAVLGDAEQAMILIAYSFFFFLGSGICAMVS
jgi:hypothetical protein